MKMKRFMVIIKENKMKHCVH